MIDIVNKMRPIYKFCFKITDVKVNQNRFPKTILGRINKRKYPLTNIFFKGSILGFSFSFSYTVYVNPLYSHVKYIALFSVGPLFFIQNINI